MGEQLEREKGSNPESLEDQKYQELKKAMDEENRVMAEIDKVLASTPDRAEAEKIVLEKLAPSMDEAAKKSGEALKAWLDAIQKEMNDMEKNPDEK